LIGGIGVGISLDAERIVFGAGGGLFFCGDDGNREHDCGVRVRIRSAGDGAKEGS